MREHDRTIAILLLFVLLLWQGGAIAHLIAVPHEICPHGKIIRSEGEHGHSHAGDHTAPPRSHDHHSTDPGCELLASLVAPNLVAGAAPMVPAVLEQPHARPSRFRHTVPLAERHRYRLSPSHSPPL